MKTHIFVGMLINAWVLFGVIDYNRNVSKLVYSRLLCIEHLCNAMGHTTISKIVRHFYNAYSAMDLKFEVFAIDYIRMTSFYIIYPLEYIYSLTLVINTLPVIK